MARMFAMVWKTRPLFDAMRSTAMSNVNVSVNVECKVTLHEQVHYRGTVLNITVCHTAGHYGEEYDD